MRVAVISHIYIYKKNRIASLLCIFETIINKKCQSLVLFCFLLHILEKNWTVSTSYNKHTSKVIQNEFNIEYILH